jgi:1-deoxy-D-xylulose-5-phosphate synthase
MSVFSMVKFSQRPIQHFFHQTHGQRFQYRVQIVALFDEFSGFVQFSLSPGVCLHIQFANQRHMSSVFKPRHELVNTLIDDDLCIRDGGLPMSLTTLDDVIQVVHGVQINVVQLFHFGLNVSGYSEVDHEHGTIFPGAKCTLISPPVGALNQYLAELMSGRFYAQAKKLGGQVLRNAPPLFALARHIEQQTQTLIQSNTIFEKLGFTYTGPIDGHDVNGLVEALEKLSKAKGPQFLHVVTRKGQGYEKAEMDPVTYHGPGKFNPSVGVLASANSKTTFTQVFGQWLCDMAAKDPRLVGITPAMREGSGMVEFSQRFPNRYHDVGIAEQHAVTFAAGLACEGFKPVVAIYSTFLQRAYDQLIHDVALQNLPVVFALDRAGLVGADGPTHAGMFDIAFTRCIPNMSVACPADENECRQLLSTAYAQDHAVTVRYPRGVGIGTQVQMDLKSLPFGKAQVIRKGEGLAILCFGPLLHEALKVAQTLNATLVNMRWAKPLDLQTLSEMAQSHESLVTLEDGTRMGGAGSAVLEALQDMGVATQVLVMGFEDEFTEHGDAPLLMQQYGLTATGIQRKIAERWPVAHSSTTLRRVV